MCSYTSINGVPSCANKELLTTILREEWGFTGYVVSDAGAVEYVRHYHNYTSNNVDTVAACVNAGCNLDLPAGNWSNFTNAFYSMVDAVKQGKLSQETISERMKPLWYTRMRLGEFDPPEMNPYRSLDLSIIQSQEHQDLSEEAAMKSFVLLKNLNNTLPLRQAPYNWIAIVGPMINNNEIFGDYTPEMDSKFTVTPYDGLSVLGGNITSGEGCNDNRCTHYIYNDIASAVHDAEIVFVCLGLGIEVEQEGRDRSNISLPGHQLQLLKDAINYSPKDAKIILIIFNAGAVDLSWAEHSERISAIIAAFYPAQATGTALRKIIINDGPYSVPAARTPYTWPQSTDQLPPMVNYTMAGRTYRYLRDDQPALYPFGYGLSYTEFWYESLHLDTPQKDGVYILKAGEDVHGNASVLNIGKITADEVIQVYIKWCNATVITPNIQLVYFSRLPILAQDRIHFSFTIKAEHMAVWLDKKGWAVEPGLINIFVGGQQPFQQKNVGSNVLNSKFLISGYKFLGKY
ncbi:uncharacterized protein LOC126832672 isoform X1 [Patella vulgata]|uniref:uncharacterized protein LOC126832672 isoform X1 n=1 Tax=Patella vulgata TaxID=6465 RepID=UPI00217F45B6|nr:uncharacterized protein LOC126832672 isoform X1 [Patella vulgata]